MNISKELVTFGQVSPHGEYANVHHGPRRCHSEGHARHALTRALSCFCHLLVRGERETEIARSKNRVCCASC